MVLFHSDPITDFSLSRERGTVVSENVTLGARSIASWPSCAQLWVTPSDWRPRTTSVLGEFLRVRISWEKVEVEKFTYRWQHKEEFLGNFCFFSLHGFELNIWHLLSYSCFKVSHAFPGDILHLPGNCCVPSARWDQPKQIDSFWGVKWCFVVYS